MSEDTVDSTDSNETVDESPDTHGPLYWAVRHTSVWLWGVMRNRPKLIGLILLLLILLRPLWHHLLIDIRMNSSIVATMLVLVGLEFFWTIQQRGNLSHVVGTAAMALTIILIWSVGAQVQRYFALHARYNELQIVELKEWPLTGYERPLSLSSVYQTAQEKLTANDEEVAEPDYVRVGSEYHWTLGIGPSYAINQAFGGTISSIFDISATSPIPNWDNRIPVRFSAGEQLALAHNSYTCSVRAMGPVQFFNYEPADVRYIPNDAGEWVEVVSLIRWSGFIFPKPEFGGVIVTTQRAKGGFFENRYHDVQQFLFGCGSWIAPEEVAQHPYLAGQNLLPVLASRYTAESFRFQQGFWGPMPGYHSGDVRIADLPADINKQPFTTYFVNVPGDEKKLFHFFAMEPYRRELQGLAAGLLIPADGTRDVVYAIRQPGLTGVSAIAAKVRASNLQIDWNNNHAVEHRPFVRDIRGSRQLFWLTTVVTKKDPAKFESITAGVPYLVLTHARSNVQLTMDALHPETWTTRLDAELGRVAGE